MVIENGQFVDEIRSYVKLRADILTACNLCVWVDFSVPLKLYVHRTFSKRVIIVDINFVYLYVRISPYDLTRLHGHVFFIYYLAISFV